MTRHCENCGFGLSQYCRTARLCTGCRETSKAAKQCPDCEAVHYRSTSPRCRACSRARWVFSDLASGRGIAASAVAKAKQEGGLSPPTGMCTDCDQPAAMYDHRDYNRPLDVDPVCKGCNVRRKSAIPKRWTFAEFMAHCQALPRHTRNQVSWRFQDALAIEKLKLVHFAGPGGVANKPLRSPATAASISAAIDRKHLASITRTATAAQV